PGASSAQAVEHDGGALDAEVVASIELKGIEIRDGYIMGASAPRAHQVVMLGRVRVETDRASAQRVARQLAHSDQIVEGLVHGA
ncbi:MAG: hypothetical protein VW396_08920, partial [Ilumatobacter sp.]